MIDDHRLAAALDELDVRRLQARYADVVTRRAWSELHDLMRADCRLELDLGDRQLAFAGPAAIGDFIGGQLEQFSFFEFVVLNAVIEVDTGAGVARARMYMQELRQGVADGRRSTTYGVYHDRFERHDDRWWFARRRYGSYSRTAAPGSPHDQDVFPLPEIPLGEL